MIMKTKRLGEEGVMGMSRWVILLLFLFFFFFFFFLFFFFVHLAAISSS